jgi:hypothetical protein
MTDFTAYVFLQLALSDVFGHVHVPQHFVLQGAELDESTRKADVHGLIFAAAIASRHFWHSLSCVGSRPSSRQ